MAFAVVTVVDGQERQRDLELPLDVPLRALGPALAQALGYAESELALGREHKAVIQLQGEERAISPDQSLGSAGVVHGDVLRFMIKPIPSILQGLEVALRFQGPGFVAPDGSCFPLRAQKTLVGRADPASGLPADVLGIDLTELDDPEAPSVSRRHAQVLLRNGSYLLQDLDSTNGTMLAEQALSQGQRAKLQHADIVRFGDVVLTFVWDCQVQGNCEGSQAP